MRRPCIPWGVLLLALLALCAGSLSMLTYISLAIALSLAILVNLFKPGCGCLRPEKRKEEAAPAAAEERQHPAAGPQPRAHWMDKLKVVLTCLVVAHHCTCVMSGGGWNLTLGHYAHPLQLPFSLFLVFNPVSYTHLTLPTIYSV